MRHIGLLLFILFLSQLLAGCLGRPTSGAGFLQFEDIPVGGGTPSGTNCLLNPLDPNCTTLPGPTFSDPDLNLGLGDPQPDPLGSDFSLPAAPVVNLSSSEGSGGPPQPPFSCRVFYPEEIRAYAGDHIAFNVPVVANYLISPQDGHVQVAGVHRDGAPVHVNPFRIDIPIKFSGAFNGQTYGITVTVKSLDGTQTASCSTTSRAVAPDGGRAERWINKVSVYTRASNASGSEIARDVQAMMRGGVPRLQIALRYVLSRESLDRLTVKYIDRVFERSARAIDKQFTADFIHARYVNGTVLYEKNLFDLIAVYLGSDEAFWDSGGSREALVGNWWYPRILRREADIPGRDFWVGRIPYIGHNPSNRETVALEFLLARETVELFVRDTYLEILKRHADSGGLEYWANFLQNSGGELEEVMGHFFASDEFYNGS